MTRIIFSIILGLAATAALAGNNNNNDGCQGNCPQGGGTSTATATVGNVTANGGTHVQNTTVTNVVAPVTTQGQVQGQKQGQAQGQKQNVKNSGNNTGTATVGVTVSQPITFEAAKPGAAAASAPAMNTTTSCRNGVGVGAQVPLFGGSVGFTVEDAKCSAREKGRMLMEAARIAQSLGAPAEFYGPLFVEGVELVKGSDSIEQPAPEKATGKSSSGAAVEMTPVSFSAN